MHLRGYAVNQRLASVLVDVVDKLDELRQLRRIGLQVVVVYVQLHVGRCVLARQLERLHGVVLAEVVAPIEVAAAPVEVKAVGGSLGRLRVILRVAVVILPRSAEVVVNSAEITVVGYRLVDDVPAYETLVAADMLEHSAYPALHGSEQRRTLLFGRLELVGDSGSARCAVGLYACAFLFACAELYVVDVISCGYLSEVETELLCIVLGAGKLLLESNPVSAYVVKRVVYFAVAIA